MAKVWLALSVQWDDCSVAIGAAGSGAAGPGDAGGEVHVFRAVEGAGSGSVASREVLVLVDRALREAGLRGPELAGLVFARGPGAFTALRVGAAIVQGLGLAWRRPVRCVDSLAVMAAAGSAAQGAPAAVVVSALDARMDEIYYAVHHCPADRFPQALRPPAVAPAAQAIADVDAVLARAGGVEAPAAAPLLIGSGRIFGRQPGLADWARARGLILQAGGAGEPDAAALLAAAFRPGAPDPGPAGEARPLYVRDRVALDRDEQRQAALRRPDAVAGRG